MKSHLSPGLRSKSVAPNITVKTDAATAPSLPLSSPPPPPATLPPPTSTTASRTTTSFATVFGATRSNKYSDLTSMGNCYPRASSFTVHSCTRNNLRFASANANRHGPKRAVCIPIFRDVHWRCLGPILTLCLPFLPVGVGLWLSKTHGMESVWNPTYGIFTCGSVGACLGALQLLLYVPVGLTVASEIALMIVLHLETKKMLLMPHAAHIPHMVYHDFEARFCMICKMATSQILVWLAAFVSNHVCLVTMWQLFAIFTGLQGLFICVSFTFSRPFLEVIFKRNDPLGRLKLDNLVMQLPLGIARSRELGATHRGNASSNASMRGRRPDLMRTKITLGTNTHPLASTLLNYTRT